MNRITQLFVVVLGTIIIGFTANAQLTVTGGNLIVPDDRVGIGTATPETLLHVEGVNNTLILARGNTQGNSVLIQVRNLSSGDAGIMVRNAVVFGRPALTATPGRSGIPVTCRTVPRASCASSPAPPAMTR